MDPAKGQLGLYLRLIGSAAHKTHWYMVNVHGFMFCLAPRRKLGADVQTDETCFYVLASVGALDHFNLSGLADFFKRIINGF